MLKVKEKAKAQEKSQRSSEKRKLKGEIGMVIAHMVVEGNKCICNEGVVIHRKHSIERHSVSQHKIYENLKESERLDKFGNNSVSRRTVPERIKDIADDIQNSLKCESTEFVLYSLAIDETTDLSNTARMAIFIRGIIAKFNIREEFLALKSMHGTTRGEDLFQMVDSTVNDFDLPYEKMSGLTTVGAAGHEKGFLALIKNEFKRYNSGPNQISVNSSTKFLAIHTSQFSLLLDLWPPQSVIHPSAKVVVSDKNNEHEENIRFEPECFLSGKPQFGRGMVSLSYCNGLHGTIVTNGSDYQIIAPRSTCAENIYLIARRASSNLMQQGKLIFHITFGKESSAAITYTL
ncbi:Hypothetical predicted protein [Octopus vulgaris]|uniref:Uncharacterized protein n=1 Tax=Octopus vulgaris TaxID=6645 RepID=A0AA36BIZ7_OCTVU|nr:Hypothetical predicted protein [Octopus vulgaris]